MFWALSLGLGSKSSAERSILGTLKKGFHAPLCHGMSENIKISEEDRKEGGEELTRVNWGPVDPA